MRTILKKRELGSLALPLTPRMMTNAAYFTWLTNVFSKKLENHAHMGIVPGL
jgi:hypothetical protein